MALESGCPVAEVEVFLRATLPEGLSERSADEAAVVFADVRSVAVDPGACERLLSSSIGLPMRARVHLALGRSRLRAGRATAAGLEFARASSLLGDWPGWLLSQVEQDADTVAVHLAALLRVNEESSRTALATRHVRAQLSAR